MVFRGLSTARGKQLAKEGGAGPGMGHSLTYGEVRCRGSGVGSGFTIRVMIRRVVVNTEGWGQPDTPPSPPPLQVDFHAFATILEIAGLGPGATGPPGSTAGAVGAGAGAEVADGAGAVQEGGASAGVEVKREGNTLKCFEIEGDG